MKKGFVITADVVVAMLIAGIMSTAMVIAFFGVKDDTGYLSLERTANAILVTLDKAGIFDTLDSDQVNQSVYSMIPSSMGYNVLIQPYSYGNHSFNLVEAKKINITTGSAPEYQTKTKMQRTFLKFYSNGSIEYYCISELEVWYK